MKARMMAKAAGALLFFVMGDARGNLLVNPGAETGNLTGWTKGGVSNPFVDNGSFDPGINPHSGARDFVGGTGSVGKLSQIVSLTGVAGITDTQIDSGIVSAEVSFWEQGLNQGEPSDNAFISLTFLNSSNSVIGTVSTSVVDSHFLSWQNFAGSFAVPVGTRSIDYTMNFTRHYGSDLDAFIDENILTLSTNVSAVPEPSSLALAGIAVVCAVAQATLRKGKVATA